MSRMRLPILCVFAAGATVFAEPEPSPVTNLFGDDIVRKLKSDQGEVLNGVRMVINDKAVREPGKAQDNTHLLLFHDGQQLRGEIVALTQDEVAWRRAGVNESLRFARSEVQRIVLSAPVTTTEELPQGIGWERLGSPQPTALATATASTIKLGGGDWLFGDVTCEDGQTFACQLNAGMKLPIPRTQIEWLYGAAQPAPAFALSASGLGLTGWRSAGGVARIETTGGTIAVRDAAWIGRTMALPARFEVAFELPADAEDGTQLWLQPYGQPPNSYTFGTVNLRLGPVQMTRQIFLNGFAQKNVKIPESTAATPASYRVLYDAEAARLVVVRNGELLGDWKFSEERKNLNANNGRAYNITGICFDRDDEQPKRDLKFNRLEIRPWNGLVPKAGAPVPADDVLSLGKEPPRAGKLEALSEKYFVLSGTTLMREPGMFVQFPQRPAALANATGVLDFGMQGELSVADLEIRDGQAHCRTSFATAFTTPVATLKAIVFSTRAATPPAGDMLVFKNGDELPGALLSATPAGPLRWKTARGQEVEIEVAQVAGVRFAAGRDAPPIGAHAVVELRNGDLLRGAFEGLDAAQLQFRHARLGAVGIERSRVWRLYPNPQFTVCDGASDLATWITRDHSSADAPSTDEEEATLIPWLYLDGRYALRGSNMAGANWATSTLQTTAGNALERFEMRFDITGTGEDQPGFNLQFADKRRESSVQTSFSDGEFRIFFVNPKAQNGVDQREIRVTDKLTEPTTRLNVRAFVNRKTGAIDFFFDGVPVAKVGRQAAERIPGVGAHVLLQAQTDPQSAVVISNVWLGPWDGELPKAGAVADAGIALANGDVATGTPTAWHDGKFSFESDIGPLDLPLATVQSIEFGGECAPGTPVARVRLPDGAALNVDTFRWEGREFTGHSATAGDLHLPAEAVGELIFDPPPAQAPRTPASKKIAQKNPAEPAP